MGEARVVAQRLADENNAVTTVVGGGGAFCRTPCPECPWRVENAGTFPAEAFRISAPTAYDMADRTFACHMAGRERPQTCAGALLSTGADHNMLLRLALMDGRFSWDQVTAGAAELHESYAAMAIANGVDPDDPVLRPCR